jgi:hypothetical protein
MTVGKARRCRDIRDFGIHADWLGISTRTVFVVWVCSLDPPPPEYQTLPLSIEHPLLA